MYRPFYQFVLLVFLSFSLFACTNEQKEQQEEEAVENALDQILENEENNAVESLPVVPELLGTWSVVKMTMDGQTNLVQDDIGKSTYTFRENGEFVFDPKDESGDFQAETHSFSYSQNLIQTSFFPAGEARIIKLNADSLVFLIEAAGMVEYTLKKLAE